MVKRHIPYYLIVIISLFIFQACNKKSLPPHQYIKWIDNEKNGLKKIKKVKDFTFIALYKPYEYIALKESVGNPRITSSDIKRVINEIEGFYYFNFQIESADKHTPMLKNKINKENEYYARLNYFITYAQKNFQLIEGSDTIKCALYHFEQTYNLTPFNRIVLGFKKGEGTKGVQELTLIYNDEILNTGIIKFNYLIKDLKKIPNLNL
jgi:hypothetical protein